MRNGGGVAFVVHGCLVWGNAQISSGKSFFSRDFPAGWVGRFWTLEFGSLYDRNVFEIWHKTLFYQVQEHSMLHTSWCISPILPLVTNFRKLSCLRIPILFTVSSLVLIPPKFFKIFYWAFCPSSISSAIFSSTI